MESFSLFFLLLFLVFLFYPYYCLHRLHEDTKAMRRTLEKYFEAEPDRRQ